MFHTTLPKVFKTKYSSKNFLTKNVPSSETVRKTFLDYFINENGHQFVRSSPVVPFCDPTVAFVNAGMNQFKSIFLGRKVSEYQRATNSQKCVRVGGKHNDLSIVGYDGYHHTFFEMLGNWSFGDYFKREACQMAWNLLRGPMQIDTSRLYVTYFGGDENLKLGPDRECYDIWRSIGVPEKQLLPFGSRDNFWEMGATGPCGQCTEIHIDHLSHSDPAQRSRFVNAGRDDLTELWNLVFIEYNRNEDGTITELPSKHVDTGMGFERLVALLQTRHSNYETDLFTPIFDSIQQATKLAPYSGDFNRNSDKFALDTAYRILADHSRMVTACLSDGMLPVQNHKLRRILRKSLLISSNVFKRESLLEIVIPKVAEILGSAYPEMHKNLSNTLKIVAHETETLVDLRKIAEKNVKELRKLNAKIEEADILDYPTFLPAFKEFMDRKITFADRVIPGDFLFKLKYTYGLDEEALQLLAESENLTLDKEGLLREISTFKARSKSSLSLKTKGDTIDNEKLIAYAKQLPTTDDSLKYKYEYNVKTETFKIPPVQSQVVGIIFNGNKCNSAMCGSTDSEMLQIITERTNFYCESGGQQFDTGYIVFKIGDEKYIMDVSFVNKINECVFHSGRMRAGNEAVLNVGDAAELHVNETRRSANIIHHSATHLLNECVRQIVDSVVFQTSSSVTEKCLKLELGILGCKMNNELITKIEALARAVIKSASPVTISEVTAEYVLKANDITLVPGEIYPENGLRLFSADVLSLKFSSKELCCGTHVTNTTQLKDICIVNVKQTGRAKYTFHAIAGNAAEKAIEIGRMFENELQQLETSYELQKQNNVVAIGDALKKLQKEVLNETEEVIPFVVKSACIERIKNFTRKIAEISRKNSTEFIEIEMQSVIHSKPLDTNPFLIYFIRNPSPSDEMPLQKATKLCSNRPVIVASLSEGLLKARCCVPKHKIKQNFTAELWLKKFAEVFNAKVASPKGQNPAEVVNMKAKRMNFSVYEEQLPTAIKKAENFALKFM